MGGQGRVGNNETLEGEGRISAQSLLIRVISWDRPQSPST